MLKLNFQTITPLHISNGNQLAYNLEYIVIDRYLAKLNINTASKIIAEKKLFDFNRNYKFQEIIRIIEENKMIFNEDNFLYKIYTEKSFMDNLKNERSDGKKIVQEFINSNGNFYIPGSSIKGMLTTIMNRNVDERKPNYNPLGINPKNASAIDKFVITDSSYIDAENFVIDIAYRPPSINLMTLDPGAEFTATIRKMGNLNLKELKDHLLDYSFSQLKKAKTHVEKFKDLERTPKGANAYYNIIEKMLNEIVLDDEEYLVNLGFGGGSYYKILPSVPIPTFKSKKNRNKEEAHTTFAVNIENDLYQLGWCKLKIEEE